MALASSFELFHTIADGAILLQEVEAIRLLPGYAGAQGLVNWTRSEFEKSSQEVLGGASFETFSE